MWLSRQTHSGGAERPRGSSSRGSCNWKPGASLFPAKHGLWCSSHPGALSSCCVCASFFCAPHRCYENLRSPAGKVTSARAASPQVPVWGPAVGGAGSLQPNQLLILPVRLFLSLSTLFLPNLPPPVRWLTGSEFSPCVPLLSSAREIFGEIFQLRRGPWLLAPPLMS